MLKIGKYVNTHGIKGEIRILSDFSRKDLIFVPNFKIYIGDKEYIIKNYRKHKNYDMITLDGINNINDIVDLKGSNVYINRNDINEFIDEDLYNYKVVYKEKEYDIIDILVTKSNKILVLNDNKMVPYVTDFIVKLDIDNKKIYMNLPDNML
ncbi:MAG: 16S rRNA processing protein RimM [Bacilli bacterium]|nr:16S rRNA processing protein RimM [Bacilli bacterium]